MRAVVVLVLLASACGLEEREDFLIGRQCSQSDPASCDEGQKCLAHDPRPADYRCRDRASFELIDGQEPPLAYCATDDECPEDLVCNADRIRLDGGLRPLVCKRPDDVFAPPEE